LTQTACGESVENFKERKSDPREPVIVTIEGEIKHSSKTFLKVTQVHCFFL
jgi:hypothetical protein